MAPQEQIDLWAPFTSDTILEVRAGKLQKYKGLHIESGIDKSLLHGPVHIGKLGIDGDEHDLTFHGGPDKAIHGYCCAHYPDWAAEFPSAAPRFVPGGFGENLVTAHMNERNVCIGDIVTIVGSSGEEKGPLLQVSLPRQPCFKLNHRFELKNFAPNTWKLSRTGWYYRVLREGTIHAGDRIVLVERKYPEWTIERIQEYLHRDTGNLAMNEALAAIPEFGKESNDAFANRAAKQRRAEAKKRGEAVDDDHPARWRDFEIVDKKRQTARVTSLVLEARDKVQDADLGEGAHAKMRIPVPGRNEPLVRTYSVVSGDKNRFEIGVALDDSTSRGGSRYLHQRAQVGDVLQVGRLTAMEVRTSASSHVFVAGGIGITAFLPLVETLHRLNFDARVHYVVRSAADDIPFRARLLGDQLAGIVTVYDKAAGQRLSIPHILQTAPWNSRLYFCGPPRMMEEARRATQAAGIPADECHFEAFSADGADGGDPFEVAVVVDDKPEEVVLPVKEDETLLEVLQRRFGLEGRDIPSSCEVGNCGTCKIRLRSGRVEHRGTALMEEDKAEAMLSCVSRGVGRITIEI